MTSSKYLYKHRNRDLILFASSLLVSSIYIIILRDYLGFDETLKYLFAFMPLFFIMGMSVVLFNKFYSFQKGISGEDKVEKILKRHKIIYKRNVKSSTHQFDYDFVFEIKQLSYLLEVKNYTYLDKKTVNKHIYWLKHNTNELVKEDFITAKSVRPILIYTNAQPQDMSKKLIMTPEMFDEFLQAELLD